MTRMLRRLDTGLRGARANLAMTAAIAELHRDGKAPDTLRFQTFPPSAIVGRHQVLEREVRLDRCRENGIETARRMTGGGAIYMGPGLLGFELIAERAPLGPSLEAITANLCAHLALGLGNVGIAARYRPRNDIEVGGRKISGTGGYVDGRTLVFQGTVLIDFDVADMADALTLPIAKLDRKGLTALAERVVSLRDLLGHVPDLRAVQDAVAFGIASAFGDVAVADAVPTEAEERLANLMFHNEFGRDEFVAGEGWAVEQPGFVTELGAGAGRIEAHVRVRQGPAALIERIWITGDLFVAPPRGLSDLEAALVGTPLHEAGAHAKAFLDAHALEIVGAAPGDLIAAITEAAAVLRTRMVASQ